MAGVGGTRRREMTQSEKAKARYGAQACISPTVSSLSKGAEEGSPQPAPGWHLNRKGTAPHFLYKCQEAGFSLSGPSEARLSNSASKLHKLIF